MDLHYKRLSNNTLGDSAVETEGSVDVWQQLLYGRKRLLRHFFFVKWLQTKHGAHGSV